MIPPRRFVILEHDFPFLHWDLLMQEGDALASWRLLKPVAKQCWIPAELLPPHRLMYLDYEGPVSGGRGSVRRTAAGTFCSIALPKLITAVSDTRASGGCGVVSGTLYDGIPGPSKTGSRRPRSAVVSRSSGAMDQPSGGVRDEFGDVSLISSAFSLHDTTLAETAVLRETGGQAEWWFQ
ncbi:MAG: hypothetical protein KDA89_11315 [Planctomycetaceae bacterium]|nr:hypothetical protein [Planctomycetaceae bacterium]